MRTVFLDTAGMLAVWDKRDQWHAKAIFTYQELTQAPIRFYTSEWILLECANATSRTTLRQRVVQLRNQMLALNCLLAADDAEIKDAWDEFHMGKPGQAGVIDLVSFGLMRKYGISEAFTNDQHFKAAGFTTLF